MQPNMELPAMHASFILTTLSSLPLPSHINKVSVGPLLKTNQWLVFRLMFMIIKVSQTITKYVLIVYVMQTTGMGAAPAAHSSNYGSRTQQVAATPANMNESVQTWTRKHDWANAHEQVQANMTGHMHTNEGRQMRMKEGERIQTRVGRRELANRCGQMRVGEQEWANTNKGGWVWTKVGKQQQQQQQQQVPPPPPFIYLVSSSLSETASVS